MGRGMLHHDTLAHNRSGRDHQVERQQPETVVARTTSERHALT
jgi:hypothetical protein